ncbi:MAG: helix-turn-helix domain-containing protein [Armatimonadetes bacterium]|nr:helix-turn-helix domain-containing protein [Armatimonadota bacterium]
MSKSRHASPEPHVLVRTWPLLMPSGYSISFFDRHWTQLAYAVKGVMTVSTEQGSWTVPPHRAVWVPAGIRHEVTGHGRVDLRCLYFHPSKSVPRECSTVAVTPLVRELIDHVALTGALLEANPHHRRLADLLIDLLPVLPVLPTHLPQPSSPNVRAAAGLLQDPRTPVEAACDSAGLSRRTLERRFREETGLSLGAWRQQARLTASLRHLAAGEPVGRTAYNVGYESESAFVSAFRKAFGVTPGAMFK